MESDSKKRKATKKLELYNARLTEDDDFDEDDDYYDPYENLEDGGVVYTPTKSTTTKTDNNINKKSSKDVPPTVANKPKHSNSKPPVKKKKSSTSYTLFVIGIITAGIAVSVLALVIMFGIFSSNKTANNAASQSGSNVQNNSANTNEVNINENIITNETQQSVTGVIKNISGKNITVYIFSLDEAKTFFIDNLTEFKDKYGKGISFAELKIGDIVDVAYFPSKEAVTTVQANSQVWVSRNITNVTADKENKTISIGNKIYLFTDELVFLNSEKLSDLANLTSADVISVSGYKDQLWTIFVEKAQAYIKVIPNERIENGIIEVDTNVFLQLSDADKVQVSEGKHRIVIKGNNIEPLTKEVQISAGQTYELDLSEVQIKRCMLVVNVNTTDYSIYVNDVLQTSTTEPLVLEFGKYSIRVEKEDYHPYSNTFDVRQESAVLNVTLEEIPKECTATIETIPSGADVFLNNVFIGVTPFNTVIPFGEHRLSARKSEYYEISIPITVSLKEEKFLINLNKIPEVKEPDPPVIETEEEQVGGVTDGYFDDTQSNENDEWIMNNN